MKSEKYSGIGISDGKVSGRIRLLKDDEAKESPKGRKGRDEELLAFDRARHLALLETNELEKKALIRVGEAEAQIFEIHAMLLEDEDYIDTVIGKINGGKSAIEAVECASREYCQMLEALDDEYLSARTVDIKDISAQLIRILSGGVSEFGGNSGEPYILVASDLTPSQTVRLDADKILGFVTFGGTPSSHTAILARAMGIPAIVGTGAIDKLCDGELGLLNAEKGTLVVSPTKEEIEAFEKERCEYNKIAKEHESYLRSVMNKPAVTRGGHKIMIYANVGEKSEIASALSNGAEGIGLLRSEFLYLAKEDYPSEEELFESYRDVAVEMQGKRVIVRTLDIGADKQASYFNIPKEENPALGYRAIRICLDRRDVFKTQIRAILRASALGSVALMLPMVTSVGEVREAMAIIEECKRELSTQGAKYDAKIEIGIMIETPAAAIMSEELAPLVDFFSVGTNDLTQYTLAADRQNPRLARMCEENTEPVMRLIRMAADAIHQRGGWIGVCGEMAADLTLTQRFADMGIDELSVSAPYLLGVRGKVSECR